MAIRAAVLDLDGTLIGDDGRLADGVSGMLAELEGAGIRIAIASNRPSAMQRAAAAGIAYDLLLTYASVGNKKKGSPQWVAQACAEMEVRRQELIWLGDGDNDMRSAVNGKVAYFNAGWSAPDYPYGISLAEPRLFSAVVLECFAKPVDWYWQMSLPDPAGRPVEVRAMTDARGGGNPKLETTLRGFLKDGYDPGLGPLRFGEFVTFHLLGSIYSAGFAKAADTWTVYPGSQGGPNASLGPFVATAARLFRDRYVHDLLVRHTPAVDSGQARNAGQVVDYDNQINTVHLNPSHRARIEGKHVVVVDDFETQGYSFECARNLLLEAGAATVTCICMGKYGTSRRLIAPVAGYNWNPYLPRVHNKNSFSHALRSQGGDPDGPAYFKDSCYRFAKM
jgi:soluble P-type ATPase